MKSLLILSAVLMSFNHQVRAEETAAAVAFFPSFTYTQLARLTSGKTPNHKEAQIIQNDAQEYFQSGSLSLILENQVELITAENPELSEREAVGTLLDMASAYLALREEYA